MLLGVEQFQEHLYHNVVVHVRFGQCVRACAEAGDADGAVEVCAGDD